jgi:hypothetical protein
MKYLIYYVEEEVVPEELAQLEATEEAKQAHLANRWAAFIPMIPTHGEGATREAARESAIRNAYEAIASYLQSGKLNAGDFVALSFEDSPDNLTPEDLGKMGPQFDALGNQAAAE